MEKLRPMTAKEKLCHVSNQMFVYLMAYKHLLHSTAVTQPMCHHLPCGHDSTEMTSFKNYILAQSSKTNSISHF